MHSKYRKKQNNGQQYNQQNPNYIYSTEKKLLYTKSFLTTVHIPKVPSNVLHLFV